MTAEKAFFLYCSLKKAVSFSLTAFLSMSHKTSTFLHKLRWGHTISLRETLGEVTAIGEANSIHDFRYAKLTCAKQFCCLAHTHVSDNTPQGYAQSAPSTCDTVACLRCL